MDRRAVHAWRQLAHAGDAQHALLDRDLDLLRLDTGQRRNDRQFLLGLEHIDRRLPIHRRGRRQPRLKEPAMQLLRPPDHRAGFRPHPASRIGCAHWTCILQSDRVGQVLYQASAFVIAAGPRRRETVYRKPVASRSTLCLVTTFTSPTDEKPWKIPKEWTCRATPRRERRRWCSPTSSDTAKPSRAAVGKAGSSPSRTNMGTRSIPYRSPTCWTNEK